MPQEGIAVRNAVASWIAPSTSPPTILLHQRAPHDHAVRERTHLRGLCGGADPDAHEQREVRVGAERRDDRPRGLLHAVTGAGHAVRRHAVDEAS